MEIRLSNKALKQTKLCQKDFQCLKGEDDCLCPVEKHIEGNGLFIRKTHEDYCSYELLFGSSSICTCPTRIEIYERYDR